MFFLYYLGVLALLGIGFLLIFGQPFSGALYWGIGFIIAAYYVAWRGRLYRKRKIKEQAANYRNSDEFNYK